MTAFFCEKQDCEFALWKDNKFFTSKKKTVTKPIAAALLKEGRVSVSGLYSEKTGKTYDAVVVLDDTEERYVNFKLLKYSKAELNSSVWSMGYQSSKTRNPAAGTMAHGWAKKRSPLIRNSFAGSSTRCWKNDRRTCNNEFNFGFDIDFCRLVRYY